MILFYILLFRHGRFFIDARLLKGQVQQGEPAAGYEFWKSKILKLLEQFEQKRFSKKFETKIDDRLALIVFNLLPPIMYFVFCFRLNLKRFRKHIQKIQQ